MSRKNDSGTYSYYFDKFAFVPYDFTDKENCIRNYMQYMFNRTQRIFEYKGLPDTIPQRMLEFLLQINGFACICKVKGELYAMRAGLGGEPDAYYRPTIATVANPALNYDDTLEIGKDCVVLRNDSFLLGLTSLFSRYATAMTENDLSFRMISINTRIQDLLSAPDDNTKAAAEQFLKDVEAGKLGVIASNEFLDGIKVQPMAGKNQRMFTDLIEYQQYLKASWFNEIGLNANYNMKREKLSTTESQMNNDALLPLVDDMLESRRKGLEEINEMFGTHITVEFASSWEKLLEEFESNQLDGGMNDDNDASGDTSSFGDDSSYDENASSGEPAQRIESGDTEREVSSMENNSKVSDEVGDTVDSSEESASGIGESNQLDEVNPDVQVNVQVEVEVNDDAESELQDESDDSVQQDADE